MQIDPENMLLLEQHLACASAESYLQLHSDQQYFGPKIFKAADILISEGKQICIWLFEGYTSHDLDQVSVLTLKNRQQMVGSQTCREGWLKARGDYSKR